MVSIVRVVAVVLAIALLALSASASAMTVYSAVDRFSDTVVLDARIYAVVPEGVCGRYLDLYTMWVANPGFRDEVVGEVKRQFEEVLESVYAGVGLKPDVASLSIDYHVERLPSGDCGVNVKLHAVLHGVCQGSGSVVVRYRYVRLDKPLYIGGFKIVPSETFFIDFSPFKKPLGDWEKVYNGTHTIFHLHIDSVEVEVGGTRVHVDPEMVIVVQGYAEGAGDMIVFRKPLRTTTVTKTRTVTVVRSVTVTRYTPVTVTVTATEAEATTVVAQTYGLNTRTMSIIAAVVIAALVAALLARKTHVVWDVELKKYVRRRKP